MGRPGTAVLCVFEAPLTDRFALQVLDLGSAGAGGGGGAEAGGTEAAFVGDEEEGGEGPGEGSRAPGGVVASVGEVGAEAVGACGEGGG